MLDGARKREAGLVGRRVGDRSRGTRDACAAVRGDAERRAVDAWVWSRLSDHVTVTVVPLAATAAELIVGAAVSTRNDRVALNEELAAEESTFFARQ